MIYDVLTDTDGLISIIAKGIKSKKDGLSMQPFKEIKLTFTKAKLPLLTKHEVSCSFVNVSKKYMLAGLYFNELIYKFIPKNEPLPSLYNLYKNQLNYMNETDTNLENVLFRFEYLFLKEIGYEINHIYHENYNINKDVNYFYKFGEGFKEQDNTADHRTMISSESLFYLLNNKFEMINDIENLRFIAKNIIKENLGDKNIKSYDMFD